MRVWTLSTSSVVAGSLLLVGDDDAHLAGSQRRSSKDGGPHPSIVNVFFPVVGDVARHRGSPAPIGQTLARNSLIGLGVPGRD